MSGTDLAGERLPTRGGNADDEALHESDPDALQPEDILHPFDVLHDDATSERVCEARQCRAGVIVVVAVRSPHVGNERLRDLEHRWAQGEQLLVRRVIDRVGRPRARRRLA